jgi:hypothetical protein
MLDLDGAVAILDAAAVSWSEGQRVAWRLVRSHARRGRRISSTTLPAIGTAAQHASLAREHASLALDALGGAVNNRDGDEEPEE